MEGPDVAKLKAFMRENAEGDLLSWTAQLEMMQGFNLSCYEADAFIMQHGMWPARYQRNRTMITIPQQLKLHKARVAVVGCGGLGGYILEELARLGVGNILAIDPDVFEEHNLNRQLLATIDNLEKSKVEAAVQRIKEINPAVLVSPQQVTLSKVNGNALLKGADIVVDAIDNISGRLELAEVCSDLDIPLVHGAIAGWFGQVVTVYPGENTLQKLYANWTGGKGIEAGLGNPSFTPAVAASLQVAETCKLLLGQGRTLREGMLSIDLLNMQFDEIPLC